MTGTDPGDRQAGVDIHRAGVLLALARGVELDAGAEALKVRAALHGVSLHEAALAILWPDPVARPVAVDPGLPGRHRRRRHLFAVPSRSGGSAAASTEEMGSAGWSGRPDGRGPGVERP